jgi:hypothetical protein
MTDLMFKSTYNPVARQLTHDAVAAAETFSPSTLRDVQAIVGSNRTRSVYINTLVSSTSAGTATYKVRLYVWDELLNRYAKGQLVVDQTAVTLALNSDSGLYEYVQPHRADVGPETCVFILETLSVSAGTPAFSMTVLPSMSY